MKRALALMACLFGGALYARTLQFDVVVYGGTAGGVITAMSAAREGARVALLEPGRHLGGMVSGGLGKTDYGRKEVIGGYSLEFFERAGKHYGAPIAWFFEPHVAEQVFRDWVKEAGVTVFFEHRLREKDGVKKSGRNVDAIFTENGEEFRARIFADASYEGDLMAQAGVSYTVGREGAAQYHESLAGVRPKDRNHMFDVRVGARDEHGRLLPEISSEPRGAIGAADRKVQAYNFRLCLSKDPANQVPYPKPPGYDATRFELLRRLIGALSERDGHAPRMGDLLAVDEIPKNKTDINNRGAFSTDYIGGSWNYPEASYARRAEIWRDHVYYVEGLLYFLANDPRVPESLREEMKQWGLAKDEFVDTNHWPHQLYVREARRMVGDFVMIQKDVQVDREKSDSIGMGSYNSDSHNVQRYEQADGSVQNEGNMEVPVQPYQIPYRVMLPKRAEALNLLVPVCFSASHVTYSTLRMEPQYMIIGQAAGMAAKLAIESGKAVQDIDVSELQKRLRAKRAVLALAAK